MNDLSSSAILTTTDLHFRAQQVVPKSGSGGGFRRSLWGFYKEIRAADCHPDSKQQRESSHPWRRAFRVERVEQVNCVAGNFTWELVFLKFAFREFELQDCFVIMSQTC